MQKGAVVTGVELIVGALAAGSAAGIANTASSVISEAYTSLKGLLARRLAGRTGARRVLDTEEADPQVWLARLGADLMASGSADDERILAAARGLLDLLDAGGMSSGKYRVDLRMASGVQVGDHSVQNNTFSWSGHGMDKGDLGQRPPSLSVTINTPNGVQIGDGNSQRNDRSDLLTDHEEVVAERTSRGSGLGVAVFLLLVFGGYVLFADSFESKPSFPSENGQRPAGSNDRAVLKVAVDALRSCAKVAVVKPVNCPQQVDSAFEADVSQVAWRLHGDAGDGARIVYNGKEGRFHVLGTAVMTVTYRSPLGRKFALLVVNYWARVEWVDGRASLAEIREYDDSPKPPIRKRDPSLSADDVFPLVERAFRRCVSAGSAPMPPECPASKRRISADKAKWNLNGSPLVNARVTFDSSSGLIHVVGNYSVTAAYSVPLVGPTSQTDSGEYDAVISIDGGKPHVLAINGS